jgi:hypothetical protein
MGKIFKRDNKEDRTTRRVGESKTSESIIGKKKWAI